MSAVTGTSVVGVTVPAVIGGSAGDVYVPPPVVQRFPTLSMQLVLAQQFAASPTFTNDTSPYVRLEDGISWSRGRTDPLGASQPGTSAWTFDNSDGRFTAGRAASPYYPNVKPNRRVQLSATWQGVTYRLFTHFVDAWPTAFEGGVLPTAAMTATDRTKLLTRKKLLGLYLEEVAKDRPAALYMMGEGAGAAWSVNNLAVGSAGSWPGRIAPVTWGSNYYYGNPGPFPDGSTSLRFLRVDGGQQGSGIPNLPAFTALPFTVEMWAKITPIPAAETSNYGVIWEMQGPEGGQFAGCGIYQYSVSNRLFIQFASPQAGFNQAGWTQYNGLTDASYADNQWHHIVGTFAPNSAWLWIDGQPVAHAASAGTPTYAAAPGSRSAIGRSCIGQPWFSTMDVAGFAAYPDTVLPNARILAHYTTGKTLGVNEYSGARIGRILAASAAPEVAQSYTHTIITALDNGNTRMGLQDTSGQVAWEAASAAVDAEQGLLYFNGAGTARFLDRDAFWAPPVTFTLTGAQIGVEFNIVTGDDLLVNECVAAQKNSSPYIARNLPSQDDYGVYTDSLPDVPISDEQMEAFAQYRVSRYGTPQPRTYQVTISPTIYPALYPAMLACEPGQRFTITGLPSPLPATLDLIVQHVAHNVNQQRWETTLIGSPTDLKRYAVWEDLNRIDDTVSFWDSGAAWAY